MRTVITDYISGQEEYILPEDFQPKLNVEVFNKKKNTWETKSFDVRLHMIGKKRKTDRQIKVILMN